MKNRGQEQAGGGGRAHTADKKMYYYKTARNTDLIYQTGNPIISILQDFSLRVFD